MLPCLPPSPTIDAIERSPVERAFARMSRLRRIPRAEAGHSIFDRYPNLRRGVSDFNDTTKPVASAAPPRQRTACHWRERRSRSARCPEAYARSTWDPWAQAGYAATGSASRYATVFRGWAGPPERRDLKRSRISAAQVLESNSKTAKRG